MPRTSRASQGGYCYHILNRGNGRNDVFHKPEDFRAFLKLLVEAQDRLPLRVTGYCLMTNRFHLLLWPHADGDLSRFMQWLLTSHVRRYHRHYRGSGHVWQGRFKAFPIQQDEHYLSVLRYVERNPLRAELVDRAQVWPWSSLSRPVVPEAQGLWSEGARIPSSMSDAVRAVRGWAGRVDLWLTAFFSGANNGQLADCSAS